jgi:hypothetical protein
LAGDRGKPIRRKSIELISRPGGFKKESVKIRFLALATASLAVAGCLFPSQGPAHPARIKSLPPAATTVKDTPRPWIPFLRKPKKTAPRASMLLETGTVRQVSPEGSFAIVDLAPGVSVSAGEILLATAVGHAPSKVRVTEVQPPCFAVEITEGTLSPRDILKR